MAFGQDFEGQSQVGLYKRFIDFLNEQYELGRRTVLIVDEAQNLGSDALEELRMLSNVNTHQRELLQIVLSGQPELKQLLAAPGLTQFVQRVSSDFHLALLERKDVIGYVEHRLRVAGARRPLFSHEACDLICYATQGTPRLINMLCDTALLYGYASEAPKITTEIVAAGPRRQASIRRLSAAVRRAPRSRRLKPLYCLIMPSPGGLPYLALRHGWLHRRP